MKKLASIGLITTSFFTLAACTNKSAAQFDASKEINVYTRDTSSGTREGFFTAIDAKNAKENNQYLHNASETTSNGDMINKIKGDEYGIGYISLTSLDDSGLKGLSFNGVEATEENVISGSYKMSREFSYVTVDKEADTQVSKLVNEFHKFLASIEGEASLLAKGVILKEDNNRKSYAPDEAVCGGTKTAIEIGGSTSVEGAAKALTSALMAKCPAFDAKHAHGGSGDSDKVGKAGEVMHIGFSSAGQRASWIQPNTYQGDLGKDAIVTVVNPKNTLVDISKSELQEIYIKVGAKHNGVAVASNTKNITKWQELIK